MAVSDTEPPQMILREPRNNGRIADDSYGGITEMQKASELAEAAGLRYIWIGGYTSVRDNTAYGHWITGEMFDYQNWYPGEPSRDDLDGTPEMYRCFGR